MTESSSTTAVETTPKPRVVMSIHFPVSAKNFVLPLVEYLNARDIHSELWVQDSERHREFLNEMPGPMRLVESDLSANPVKFWKRLSVYRRHLRDTSPEVLHAHQTRASLIPMVAAWCERVPVRIYHNHGLPYLGYKGVKRWLLRCLEKVNMRLASEVVMVSHSNRQAAIEDTLLSMEKGLVIGQGSAVGIDLSCFDWHDDPVARRLARTTFQIPQANFVLGYVGRPVSRKGFHLLLSAWEKTGLGKTGGKLLIAGCSQQECEDAHDGALDGIVGLGYISNMHDLYAACDVITLPSEHEGFPYSLLEAAAGGRATLGTDIPGIRCAIDRDVTGLLIPPKNEAELCDAILKLANDEQLRTKLGTAGRLRVEQEFERETVLSRFYGYYLQLLGDERSGVDINVIDDEASAPLISDVESNEPEEAVERRAA